MSLTQFPPQSRAKAVWTRFVGMFGGESVSRRFGDEPPAEWVGVISQLNDYQLERGMRRTLARGRGTVPSLPEFMRSCKQLQDEELDETSAPALPAPQAYAGDAWDVAANRHLLAYIAQRAGENPQWIGRGASVRAMQAGSSANADAPPEFIGRVARLVTAKKAWAADMRDLAQNGEVPVETQRAIWADYMARAA